MEESELDSLKTAMINNSVKDILDLKEKYKYLVVRKISDSELDSFNLKQDELSNDLIPKDTITEFKVKENKEVYCIKTRGDGNCMFRSVSVWLVGNQSLHPVLRLLTAIELYLNAEAYANNSKIRDIEKAAGCFSCTLLYRNLLLDVGNKKLEENLPRVMLNE